MPHAASRQRKLRVGDTVGDDQDEPRELRSAKVGGVKRREVDGDGEFSVQGCGRDWSRPRRPSHGRAVWTSSSTFDPHFFDVDLVYSFFF
jgi:hypothetical protein